jgi:hypothetical protein
MMTTPRNPFAPITKPAAFLLAFAGLCLAIALLIAWYLGVTLFYPDGYLARLAVERADIIRAHIDYLMMAQFLFIFSLLFRQYAISPPAWIVASCCFGAFFNPLAFLVRGFSAKPEAVATLPLEPHFPIQAGISFSLTTIGFLGSVALVLYAVWREKLSD